jgi:1-acyl-sn-glycerol-3-phosphate acyltransferase
MLFTRLGVPKLWHEDPEAFWRFGWRVVTPLVLRLAPSAAYGAERIPREGGAVVAANHLSWIDHPLIGSFCPRSIRFLAKAELVETPLAGDFVNWTGAVFVRRGESDREALRRARQLAREGELIGVHLEGTRQRFGYPGPIKPGGLMIAMQEGVPVIPCGVETFRWSPKNRRQCAVVWGEPISLDDLPRGKRGYEQAGELVGAELVRLWRLAAEAVGAGLPEELTDGTTCSGRNRRELLEHLARTQSPRRMARVSH